MKSIMIAFTLFMMISCASSRIELNQEPYSNTDLLPDNNRTILVSNAFPYYNNVAVDAFNGSYDFISEIPNNSYIRYAVQPNESFILIRTQGLNGLNGTAHTTTFAIIDVTELKNGQIAYIKLNYVDKNRTCDGQSIWVDHSLNSNLMNSGWIEGKCYNYNQSNNTYSIAGGSSTLVGFSLKTALSSSVGQDSLFGVNYSKLWNLAIKPMGVDSLTYFKEIPVDQTYSVWSSNGCFDTPNGICFKAPIAMGTYATTESEMKDLVKDQKKVSRIGQGQNKLNKSDFGM